MRCFNPEQTVNAGKYLIISAVVYEGNNLLVVTRGKKLQLVTIPTEILSIDRTLLLALKDGIAILLEIKKAGGYKTAQVRTTSKAEVDAIDAYADPEGTIRGEAKKREDYDFSDPLSNIG